MNMDKESGLSVSYLVHESVQARLERVNKRLVCALILSLCLMFASNLAWLWAWSQYEYTGESVTRTLQDITIDAEDGNANYIGNDGDIVNGENSGEDADNDNQTEDAQKREW